MKRETFFCDGCGAELPEGTEAGETRSNLDAMIGDYKIRIDVTKKGMVTELCQECLIGIVSYAILESDPHVTMTTHTELERFLHNGGES